MKNRKAQIKANVLKKKGPPYGGPKVGAGKAVTSERNYLGRRGAGLGLDPDGLGPRKKKRFPGYWPGKIIAEDSHPITKS